jgi:Zn-dependent protease with chaperone function
MRFLPLVPLMVWLSWSDRPAAAGADASADAVTDPGPLLTLLALLLPTVAVMAAWGRSLVRRHPFGRLPTRRFQLGLLGARAFIVAWYALCVFGLGFGAWVNAVLDPFAPWHLRLPGLLLGTGPVLLGWLGLAWASYPVERAQREGALLDRLNAGLNVHAPPGLRDALAMQFRTQVLFLLAPILATLAVRDVAAFAFAMAGSRITEGAEGILFLASLAVVFVASPELLVRVLRARPLPPSPLRDRLEVMAHRLGLRYRDILVWHTSYGIGNAAVMGLVPRFRYVLLTDLLIETLDDRQIEAVFAHEAGHVRHRHLMWYVVFFAIFLLSMAGPAELVWREFDRLNVASRLLPSDLVVFVAFSGVFLAMFGMLSRLFERQADLYAARSVESLHVSRALVSRRAPVGPMGAESFVSALVRVAEINHLPMDGGAAAAVAGRHPLRALIARASEATIHFLHPSVPARVAHLREIAGEPARAERFDRRVAAVMLGMVVALTMLATWVGVGYLRQQQQTAAQPITFDPAGSIVGVQ